MAHTTQTPPAKTKANSALASRAESITRGMTELRPIVPIDISGIEANEVDRRMPELLMLRPSDLWIDPRYQRDISRSGNALIRDIVANFSWHKYRPPVVSRDLEGRYVVIDGQHTAIGAASHPGIDKIPVSFVAMDDVAEQARSFLSHNTAMVRVPEIDKFFAAVTAQDETAVLILDIMTRHGVMLARHLPAQGVYEPNQTIATGRLRRLMKKYGPAKFNEIISLVSRMNYRPIKSDHLAAVAEILFETKPEYVKQHGKVSGELLVNVVLSLNDADALSHAARHATTSAVTKAAALAEFYRQKYRENFRTK